MFCYVCDDHYYAFKLGIYIKIFTTYINYIYGYKVYATKRQNRNIKKVVMLIYACLCCVYAAKF